LVSNLHKWLSVFLFFVKGYFPAGILSLRKKRILLKTKPSPYLSHTKP
jgi:hypothetical protein